MLITHDMGVIAETAHRVAVMYAGRIVEIGPVRDVLQAPQHPYTVGLMGSIPLDRRTSATARSDRRHDAAAERDTDRLRISSALPACGSTAAIVERPDLMTPTISAGRVLAVCDHASVE